MRIGEIFGLRVRAVVMPVAGCLLLFACSVNVKKEGDGKDKQVDIKTPMGDLHVSKGADAGDVGLSVYPGARPKPKGDGADENANVNISSFGYGLKVVAMRYESDDAPTKVAAFYKDQLKKYGTVLVCHSTNHMNVGAKSKNDSDGSHELTCDNDTGNNIELKAGTKENQHVVVIEPDSEGSNFSLVYVHMRGKEADI